MAHLKEEVDGLREEVHKLKVAMNRSFIYLLSFFTAQFIILLVAMMYGFHWISF